MKVSIAPTVTATNPHIYREQMERVLPFADRVHIDFADGEFAPTKMVPPTQAWVPSELPCDLHIMYQDPAGFIEEFIGLKPDSIILHTESDGNILGLLKEINASGIRAGVALLQNTQPEEFANEIAEAEHVLLFAGKLGYHGGEAELGVLEKIERIHQINVHAEIGWDGGVNDRNIGQIVHAGVEVVNVGSFVQKTDDAKAAYAILKGVIN